MKQKKQEIKIYNRQLKYPPVGITPATKTAHKVKKGSAIMIATHEVTIYDEEKIFALLYLIQTGKAEMQIMTVDQNFLVVKIIASIYNIAKLLNNFRYTNIIESLAKCEGMKLIYEIAKEEDGKVVKGKAITTPIYRIEPYQDKKIVVYMDLKYYQACMEKPFFLNVEYFKLKGHAKNVYKFLAINQCQKSINIDTIAERCLFSSQPPKERKRIVKESLQKIQNTELGKKIHFEIKNNQVIIKKIRKKVGIKKTYTSVTA